MKYRSKTDIITALLNTATGGVSKTRLMYEAFLSVNQMKPYLSMLQISGLLEYDQSRMIYTTTKRGTEFLALNEKLNELSGLANISGFRTSIAKDHSHCQSVKP